METTLFAHAVHYSVKIAKCRVYIGLSCRSVGKNTQYLNKFDGVEGGGGKKRVIKH